MMWEWIIAAVVTLAAVTFIVTLPQWMVPAARKWCAWRLRRMRRRHDAIRREFDLSANN